jgi:hypothetical protein
MSGATWVYVTKNFDFRPSPRSILAFKAGNHVPVTQAAADALIAAGAGELTGHEPTNEDVKDGSQPVRIKGKLYSPSNRTKEIEVIKVDRVQG